MAALPAAVPHVLGRAVGLARIVRPSAPRHSLHAATEAAPGLLMHCAALRCTARAEALQLQWRSH